MPMCNGRHEEGTDTAVGAAPANETELNKGGSAMTENVKEKVDDYFGVCPICKSHDGYLNVGRDHVFVCHQHKTAWCIGANLFSSCLYEFDEEHARNAELLKTYEVVKPTHYEETLRERALINAELEAEEAAEWGYRSRCPKVPGQSPICHR